MAATATVDLSEHSLESLQKFETTLMGYPADNPEVQQNLALVRAAIADKGGSAAPEPTFQPDPVVEAVVEAAPEVDRAALENQLTFQIMRAHKIDPSMVDDLSIEELQWILSHDGESASAPVVGTATRHSSADNEHPPGTVYPPEPVAEEERPQPEYAEMGTQVHIKEPEPTPEAPAAPAVDDEREELEGQITGPILKAYGKGRVDVPGLGSNELRFMVENPEGKVTQDQLAAAQALDAGGVDVSPTDDTDTTPTVAEVAEAIAEDTVARIEEQITQFKEGGTVEVIPAAKAASSAPQPEPVVFVNQTPPWEAQPSPDRAQEIIEREQFPIPIDLEQPPKFPADISKVSFEDLYSLHAQFHAVEARANWVIALEEDKSSDLQELLSGREVEVRNEAPEKNPDDARKKLTEAQRESLVAADPEVKGIKKEIHSHAKVLRKLKVLRDNYHRDVDRCSRQMTRFIEERSGAR